MSIRLCEVESIEPAGEDDMCIATLNIRDKVFDKYHCEAITVIATDLTSCVERVHKVMSAFNKD